MGKKKSKITYIQKKQREENRLELEKEKKARDEKNKTKKEKKAKLKRNLLRAFTIFICSVFCFVMFLGFGLIINEKRKQTNKLFNHGLVAVELDKKWGYINASDKTVIDFKFEHAYNFSKNKLALVGYNGKFGYINKKGKFVIDPIYENAVPFSGDVAICKLNEKYGTIDANGKTVTEFIYSNILPYSGDYAIAVKDKKYGIIDRQGNVIIDFKYDKIDSVNKTYFKYFKDNTIYLGFVDNETINDTFFNDKFQSITLLENGYCVYKRNGLFGLLDAEKKILLENKFTTLSYEEGGKYIKYSTTGDLYGYLDLNGEIILREKYLVASVFIDKYAVVRYSGDETYYVINKEGKHIFSSKYDNLEGFYKNRAVFKKGKTYGVIAPNGKVMFDANYKYISNFYDDGYAICMGSNSLYGVIRVDGSMKIEPKYTNMAYTIDD